MRLPYHLSALTQTAGIVALRHRAEATVAARGDPGAARSHDPRAPLAPRHDRVPERRQLRAVRAARRRRRGVAGAPGSRGARARHDRGRAERAARHRGLRARDRPVPAGDQGDLDEPHRHRHARHEGDLDHRRARSRRLGHGERRHRHAVLRPHAAAARQARGLRPDGDLQGRSAGRRAPHGGGLRHRDRPGAAGRRSATRRASGGSHRWSCRWTRPRSRSCSTSPGGPS